MEIRLFGAPALTLNGQPVTGFISNKAPALIYYLAAMEHAQMRELVATLLWTNTPELDAKRNLRTVLSNLRTVLGPFLEITRTTIRLKTESVALIDRASFVAKVKAAEQATADSSQRSALFATAADLYRGPLLEGFSIRDAEAFEAWLRHERDHLHRLALQALGELTAYYAHQGELLAGINYASHLLRLDPAREETHRRLMLLFALDGQRSAALAQYQACQAILRQEVGVEPNPETRQLFERIRAGEFDKNTALVIMPPAAGPPTVRHNLPAEFSAFVGRTIELQALQRHLHDPTCRLLTITGLGGVGKTRLALVAAQAMADATAMPFPAGIWFVPLSGVDAPGQSENRLATTIAESMHLPLPGSAPATQLVQALYDKKLLLVLDDFDQPAAIPLLTALLHGTPGVTLLVTALFRLNIRGEQVMNLVGLATPPPATLTLPGVAAPTTHMVEVLNAYGATQLFVQRARLVTTDFTLERTTGAAIVQICHLVQGLPLGIELAATWTRLLSCAEIAAEIAHNLDFLENQLADAPAQQRSLRAVFHHSWRLLSAPEQRCLRELALFRSGFTRAAATQVAGATLPLLAALIDNSFVRRSTPGLTMDTARTGTPPTGTARATGSDPGSLRYELPEVIRQFAAEQLGLAGEQAHMAARHADYYMTLLATQRPNLVGAGQSEALHAVSRDIENIRLAWQWSSDHLAEGGLGQLAQSLDPLFYFYDMRSWFQEGATVFAQTATQVAHYRVTSNQEAGATIVWAKLQARHGWFAFHLGHPVESRGLLEESLRQLRPLAPGEAVFTLNYLGALLRHLGEFAAAQRYAQEALALAQAHNDPLGASIALNILGQLASLQGNIEEARTRLRQALTLKRQIGDRWGLTYSLTYLGRVAQATGDYGAAQKLFQESLLIYQAIGDQRGIAFALQNLADTAYAAHQLDEAQAHYRESLRIYREIGNRAEASLTLARLGETTCAAGDPGLAAQQLHEALAMAWSVQATPGLLAATLGLVMVTLASGQPAQAVQPLQLVFHHPASSQAQKHKAQQLLADLGVDMTGDMSGDMSGDSLVPDGNREALTLARYVQAQLETI